MIVKIPLLTNKQALCTWVLILNMCITPLGMSVSSAEDGARGLNAKISLDFNGAELKDVLKALSQDSGLNFAADQSIRRKPVHIFLTDVSVHEAMDAIAFSNTMHYERGSSGIYFFKNGFKKEIKKEIKEEEAIVNKAGMISRVFFLKYQRLSISPIDVGGQGVVGELGGGGSGGSSSSGSDSSSSSSGDIGALVGGSSSESGSGSGDASIGRGVDSTVAKLLSPDGNLSINLLTNSIIVTDYLENLESIQRILDIIDVYPRQVMLEVQVLEVGASTISDLGVDIGGSDGALVNFVGGSRTASFPLQESIFNSFDATTGAKAAVTLGTLSFANFQAVLRMILTDSETEIIANPRVLTMNNEAAVIQLSTDTSIAKVTEQASSEGVSLTSTDTAERSETGIILKMTPQINLDDSVALYLEPSISTVSASTFFSTDFLDPTTRSIRTTVQVMNHETIVIGGLIDSSSSTSVKKVPLFGDIPLVGKLFQYTSESSIDRELLIFITPHIIEPPSKKTVDALIQAEIEPTNLEEILAELDVELKTPLLNQVTTILPKAVSTNNYIPKVKESTISIEPIAAVEVSESIEADESEEVSKTSIALDEAIDQEAEAELELASQHAQTIHGEAPLLAPISEFAALGKVITRRAGK
ncbi:MAG: type IV pilus assembly protein PilQ [Candidatus Omnitrophota bacterium]|jgi:type IV pilus assembly protein PilQ